MDGIVMGGGMGIAQGCSVRIVTERTRMAMPETTIGLFPDVAGGYFLSRCPGRVGEYLGLTGEPIAGSLAIAWGLADGLIDAVQLPGVWDILARTPFETGAAIEHWIGTRFSPHLDHRIGQRQHIDAAFSQPEVVDILHALAQMPGEPAWAASTLASLRQRSPLMLHVALAQIRRGRLMGLVDNLRMERDLVHNCFHLRPGTASETVEGIRALAIDKDQKPRWVPASIEEVTAQEVERFFASPWPGDAHPLGGLAQEHQIPDPVPQP
jgi:enoyl-CoA hydratase/carnithine racemase